MIALLLVLLALGCDCGNNSHPPASHPPASDAGPCGEGRVLCEGNCVEVGHPSCGDAS